MSNPDVDHQKRNYFGILGLQQKNGQILHITTILITRLNIKLKISNYS